MIKVANYDKQCMYKKFYSLNNVRPKWSYIKIFVLLISITYSSFILTYIKLFITVCLLNF